MTCFFAQCWWPRESMLQGSSALSEFRTSLSKVLTLWYCVKVKQHYIWFMEIPSPVYVLPFCNESDNFGVLESEHWSFILTSAAVFLPVSIEALEIKAKKSSLEIKKKTVHHYGAGRGELKKSFIKNDDSFLLTFQVAPRFPVYIVHYTTGCLKSPFFEPGIYYTIVHY